MLALRRVKMPTGRRFCGGGVAEEFCADFARHPVLGGWIVCFNLPPDAGGKPLARIFHAFCVLFPAFVGGQAVSLRERASYAG